MVKKKDSFLNKTISINVKNGDVIEWMEVN